MSLLRTALIGLSLGAAAGWVRAQPEKELGAALNGLVAARNYTWAETEESADAQGKRRKPWPTASGETAIDGYTRATVQRIGVVMLGSETAFALGRGWRFLPDLTEADREELRVIPASLTRNGGTYLHPLPHGLLAILLPAGRNFQKVGGAIAADVDPGVLDSRSLEMYLRTGALPTMPLPRSPLGLPLPATARVRTTPSAANPRVMFYVGLNQGQISRITVEFRRPTVFLNGPRTGEEDVFWRAVNFEVSEIGTTAVDIPPEAQALFIPTQGRR